MEIALLHNPTAGDREFSRRELIALLRRAGYRPEYFSLKEAAWKKKDGLRGAQFVVVAGGDGAVRKAVLELHDRGLPLALIPLGTANNICACFGIAGSPRKIVGGWSLSHRRKIDLGFAQGPWGEKLFVESAGIGLIGRTISIMACVGAVTAHRLERREDRLHRDSSVVLALAHELHPVNLFLACDRERGRKDDYLLLEAMNINRVGPGLTLAPKADPSDGFLDVISATVGERERLKRSLAHGLEGGKPRTTLDRRKVRTLHLEFSEGEFRLDDEVVLRRRSDRGRPTKKIVRVEISIRPQAFEILA